MKRTVVTLVCLLIAPMVFAQTHSQQREIQTTTEQPITVTGKALMTSEGGSVATVSKLREYARLAPNRREVILSETALRFLSQGKLDSRREKVRAALNITCNLHPMAILCRAIQSNNPSNSETEQADEK